MPGQVRQNSLVKHQVAVGPALKRKPASQPTQGLLFGFTVIEPNDYHGESIGCLALDGKLDGLILHLV